MKKCVIGAAGFIGSHLTYRLVKEGYEVVGIDNLSTGSYANVQKKRFYGLKGDFTFCKCDMNDKDVYKRIDGADTVFLLAALPRVSFSTDHPLESNYTNVNGVLNVLEACRRTAVERVVYSCSSSIFGGVAKFPTPEDSPAHPKSNYALQKYIGAEYCRLFSELYGMDTINLVYYNVFGPNQLFGGSYSTVVPAFFHAALNDGVCIINGDGEQSRDFSYVDNVVDANILAATSKNNFKGDLVNIACGETYSVNEIYSVISGFFGRELKKKNAPPRLGDPFMSLADISKARDLIGYTPSVNFYDGMIKTFEWWTK